MSKMTLHVPLVKLPDQRPATCPSCHCWRFHRHGHGRKLVRDPQWRHTRVRLERSRCARCGRTFRQ